MPSKYAFSKLKMQPSRAGCGPRQRSQKHKKDMDDLIVFVELLGSRQVKAAHETLVKSIPWKHKSEKNCSFSRKGWKLDYSKTKNFNLQKYANRLFRATQVYHAIMRANSINLFCFSRLFYHKVPWCCLTSIFMNMIQSNINCDSNFVPVFVF